MKQYVIDELRPQDHAALHTWLNEHLHLTGVDGIYWLFLDDAVLSAAQQAHTECQPFYVALELTRQHLACELLVRSRQRMRCDCIAYADTRQLNWLVAQMDAIFEQLDLIT